MCSSNKNCLNILGVLTWQVSSKTYWLKLSQSITYTLRLKRTKKLQIQQECGTIRADCLELLVSLILLSQLMNYQILKYQLRTDKMLNSRLKMIGYTRLIKQYSLRLVDRQAYTNVM